MRRKIIERERKINQLKKKKKQERASRSGEGMRLSSRGRWKRDVGEEKRLEAKEESGTKRLRERLYIVRGISISLIAL